MFTIEEIKQKSVPIAKKYGVKKATLILFLPEEMKKLKVISVI